MDFELDVRQWIEGLEFPASKRQVVDYARQQGAPAFLMLTLENLPEQSYTTAGEVAEHLTTIGPDALSGETSEAA